MARRKKEDALATREQILDAAEACFSQLGVSGTSMDSIAQKAGWSRGAVTYHFSDSIEILKAVLDRGKLPIYNDLKNAHLSHKYSIDFLQHTFNKSFRELHLNSHVKNTLKILIIRCDFSGDKTHILDELKQEFNEIENIIRLILEHAANNGEVKLIQSSENVAKDIMAKFVGSLTLFSLGLHDRNEGNTIFNVINCI